jgi:hypothetical protein
MTNISLTSDIDFKGASMGNHFDQPAPKEPDPINSTSDGEKRELVGLNSRGGGDSGWLDPRSHSRASPLGHDLAMPSKSPNCSVVRFCALAALLVLSLLAGPLWVSAAEIGLAQLLERIGSQVEHFDEMYSTVTCTETVSQLKIDASGKLVEQRKSAFDFLSFLQATGKELMVEDSRLPLGKKAKEKESKKPLLVTDGFSVLLLIFHPYYQPYFEFTLPGEESPGGEKLLGIRFHHIPGSRSPSVLQLQGHVYALEWEGNAWIDPVSFDVVRIKAGLQQPLEAVGLKKLDSDVRYARVKFNDIPEPKFLPLMATVEAQTARQHWRNIHQFSSYRLFSVETEERIKQVPTN